MKVRYKTGSIFIGETDFNYQPDDYVTIIVEYWTTKEDDDDTYYHGVITRIEEDQSGFWAILNDDKAQEKFFAFADLEGVIDGDRIPFLGGTTKRRGEDNGSRN
ncbi:hypothetical protein [Bacillus testis]|uniref:hypothetical protein n=1 Tax=Bacillus testis TaxID=1622072 RepID=UPI00067EFD8D|nr:hypothetical protein [Bacillus testis]